MVKFKLRFSIKYLFHNIHSIEQRFHFTKNRNINVTPEEGNKISN